MFAFVFIATICYLLLQHAYVLTSVQFRYIEGVHIFQYVSSSCCYVYMYVLEWQYTVTHTYSYRTFRNCYLSSPYRKDEKKNFAWAEIRWQEAGFFHCYAFVAFSNYGMAFVVLQHEGDNYCCCLLFVLTFFRSLFSINKCQHIYSYIYIHMYKYKVHVWLQRRWRTASSGLEAKENGTFTWQLTCWKMWRQAQQRDLHLNKLK